MRRNVGNSVAWTPLVTSDDRENKWMDAYVDRLIAKRKTIIDHMIAFCIVIGCFISACFILVWFSKLLGVFSVIIAVGAIYLAYMLVKRTNIEYEYIFTNGSFDIDVIYAKSSRKRIFSAECKDFEMLAKVKGSHFGQHINAIDRQIHAESSSDSDEVYFFVTPYEGRKTVVYIEPDIKILECFRRFIPGKLLD